MLLNLSAAGRAQVLLGFKSVEELRGGRCLRDESNDGRYSRRFGAELDAMLSPQWATRPSMSLQSGPKLPYSAQTNQHHSGGTKAPRMQWRCSRGAGSKGGVDVSGGGKEPPGAMPTYLRMAGSTAPGRNLGRGQGPWRLPSRLPAGEIGAVSFHLRSNSGVACS